MKNEILKLYTTVFSTLVDPNKMCFFLLFLTDIFNNVLPKLIQPSAKDCKPFEWFILNVYHSYHSWVIVGY